MAKKTRKTQIVLAALDPERQSFYFLLLRTNKQRGEFWQNVTGKIEENETYEEGGLREAIEETGLSVDSIIDLIDLGLAHDFIDDRKRDVHEKSFLMILDHTWDVKIDPQEHNEFKWIHVDEIHENLVKHKGNFEALQKSHHILKHWGL